MIFKPKKSRFMVIKKGKISERFHLKVQGEEIQSVIKNSLKDVNNVNNVRTELVQWLRKTAKSGLPEKYKSWISTRNSAKTNVVIDDLWGPNDHSRRI